MTVTQKDSAGEGVLQNENTNILMPPRDTISCYHLTFIPTVTYWLRSLLGFIFTFSPRRTTSSPSIPPPSLLKVFCKYIEDLIFWAISLKVIKLGFFSFRWQLCSSCDGSCLPRILQCSAQEEDQPHRKVSRVKLNTSHSLTARHLTLNTSLISMPSYISSAAYSVETLKWDWIFQFHSLQRDALDTRGSPGMGRWWHLHSVLDLWGAAGKSANACKRGSAFLQVNRDEVIRTYNRG